MDLLNHNLKDLPEQDLLRGFKALISNPFFQEVEMQAIRERDSLRRAVEETEPEAHDVNYVYRSQKQIGKTLGLSVPFEVLRGLIETLTEKVKVKEGPEQLM